MIQHSAGQSQYLQNIIKKKKRDKSVFPLNKSFHLGHFLRKTFQNRPRTTPGMQRSGHPCVQPTRTPLRHARTSPPAAPRAASSIQFPLIRFPSIRFVPLRSAPRRRAPGARTLTTPPVGGAKPRDHAPLHRPRPPPT